MLQKIYQNTMKIQQKHDKNKDFIRTPHTLVRLGEYSQPIEKERQGKFGNSNKISLEYFGQIRSVQLANRKAFQKRMVRLGENRQTI